MSYQMYILTFLFKDDKNNVCQGYSMFNIAWHFFIPLVIFVVAYWKIFGVIRRRARVGNTGRQEIAAKPMEPAAGTSGGKTAETYFGSTTDENPRDKADTTVADRKTTVVGRGNRQGGGQKAPKTGLSQAQINVVTTMFFITVCFVVCWTPVYTIGIAEILVRRKIYTSQKSRI